MFSQRRIYTFQELTITGLARPGQGSAAAAYAEKSPAELSDYLKSSQIPVKSQQSTVAAENVPMQLLSRVSTLKPGQGVIVSNTGSLHVLLLLNAQEGSLTEDQARPTIDAYLTAQSKRQAVDKELASLHAAAKINYFGKYADMAASAAASSAQSASPTAAASQPAQVAAASASAANDSK